MIRIRFAAFLLAFSWLVSAPALAQSNAADALREALAFGAGGANETEQRVRRQQSIEETRRRLAFQRDSELAFQIANSSFIRHFRLGDQADYSRYMYSMDFIGAYQDDPDMTLRLFADYSSSLFNVRDTKDRKLSVQPISIEPMLVDGTELFEVTFYLAGGGRKNIYWRGHGHKKKNAVLLTREELDNIAAQRLASMAASGALDPIIWRLKALSGAQ